MILTDGEFVEIEPSSPLKMLLLGDSLSTGYGIYGSSGTESFRTQTQDGLATYGMLTARMLDANMTVVAVSGIAMYKSPYWPIAFPSVFSRITVNNATPWNHANFIPDVILVNLGANDSTYLSMLDPLNKELERTNFKNTYEEFIRELRGIHPQSTIFLIRLGQGQEHVHDLIEQVKDDLLTSGVQNIHTVMLDGILPTEGMGSDNHPNWKTHIRQADVLTTELEAILGITRIKQNILANDWTNG